MEKAEKCALFEKTEQAEKKVDKASLEQKAPGRYSLSALPQPTAAKYLRPPAEAQVQIRPSMSQAHSQHAQQVRLRVQAMQAQPRAQQAHHAQQHTQNAQQPTHSQAQQIHMEVQQLHLVKRQIAAMARSTVVLFLDAGVIVQIVAYHVEKRVEFWKFRALLQDTGMVFITTETVRAEVLRQLKELKIRMRWDPLFPVGRTFHVMSGASENRRRQCAADLMKLPPFGSRLLDCQEASIYFEASSCVSSLHLENEMKLLSSNYVLIRKCQMNPVWVSMLCNGNGYLPIQRFTSSKTDDKPLIEFEASSSVPKEDDLTAPFVTMGFVDENLEAVLHTNFSFGPIRSLQTQSQIPASSTIPADYPASFYPQLPSKQSAVSSSTLSTTSLAPHYRFPETATFTYQLSGATPWALFDAGACPRDEPKDDVCEVVDKKLDKFYFFVVDGIEKELFMNEPATCDALKEQLFNLQLVQVELRAEFSLMDPTKKYYYRSKEIVPFGTCVVEKHPPSEELSGTQDRLPIQWLRRAEQVIGEAHVKTVYVVDAQVIVQVAKAHAAKDGKYTEVFRNTDYGFMTTETTRMEVTNLLKKETVSVRWDTLFPATRTFHVFTGMKHATKREAAGNILRLPPYGCRQADFKDAIMYMEAAACGVVVGKECEVKFLSCNYVLIRKCQLNPVWLSTVCSYAGVAEVPVQRFISYSSVDDALIWFQGLPSAKVVQAEDELTSPFHTQGFINSNLQAILHYNLGPGAPQAYVASSEFPCLSYPTPALNEIAQAPYISPVSFVTPEITPAQSYSLPTGYYPAASYVPSSAYQFYQPSPYEDYSHYYSGSLNYLPSYSFSPPEYSPPETLTRLV